MTTGNVIQLAFDEFGKTAGASKKAGSWYHRTSETILVFNLQKSQYGQQYYINIGLWLLALGPSEAPKENRCHIRTRLTRLVSASTEARLTALLDLETSIDDVTRSEELLSTLRANLLPVVDACSTLEGLRAGHGERFVKASLVNGDAQRLLAELSVGHGN